MRHLPANPDNKRSQSKKVMGEDGTLTGSFVCSPEHQSYNGIVHGGIIAAIIDASMSQCCMGHGIVAYTTNLSIRYRDPVRIGIPTSLETRIVSEDRGVLFSLECRITQEGHLHVEAKGRFFKAHGGFSSGSRPGSPCSSDGTYQGYGKILKNPAQGGTCENKE